MRFQPLNLGNAKEEGDIGETKIQFTDVMSLEQIIMAQKDEPQQKNCIYKLQREEKDKGWIEKFYQIRVKSIEFLQ